MLGATFDITAQVGELSARMDRIGDLLERGQIMQPHPARAINGLLPTATFSSLAQLTSIGSPPGSMQWAVRRISFGLNAGGTVTTPGTIIVFIGSNEIARTTTVPNFMTFSEYECLVTPPDDLFAVWVGGALGAGSSMIVDVAAAEYPILGEVLVNA